MKTSFTKAMMQFFGKLPGQTLAGFKQELDSLTAEDRAYFKAGLEQNGYIIEESA